jgi:KDO2-lipid IV(A) lauroyltransferase
VPTSPTALVPYVAYRAAAGVARALPRRAGGTLAQTVARYAPIVMTVRRAQVARNLDRVYGGALTGAERDRAVAATFDSYSRYFYEMFRLPSETPEWVQAHFRGVGDEHLADAARAGRGAVLALPHLGNWDFAGAWLAGQGYRVTVVAEIVEPRKLFDWFVATRAALGMRVIPLSQSAGAEVLTALRGNEMVCLLCDRDLTGDGTEVDFFGERTTLPGGPALLAMRAGAPLIPVGCYFRSGGRGEARIGPPLETARTGRIHDDVQRVTQALACRFEQLIRDAPDQWHLMQPNWPSDRERAAR